MRYSVEPRDEIFIIIKGFNFIIKFLSFAKNMGKNIGKIISRNLNGKYSEKLLDHAKQSAPTDATKVATDGIKTASKDQCKNYQKKLVIEYLINTDCLETKNKVKNTLEIPKERHIFPKKTTNY